MFVASVSFASFPVKNSPNKTEKVATVETTKATTKAEKRMAKKAAKQKAAGENSDMIAVVLAAISVLALPFGLHNWYLGENKKALWQTLLVVPGFILVIPAIISWVWQLVDLITLIMEL